MRRDNLRRNGWQQRKIRIDLLVFSRQKFNRAFRFCRRSVTVYIFRLIHRKTRYAHIYSGIMALDFFPFPVFQIDNLSLKWIYGRTFVSRSSDPTRVDVWAECRVGSIRVRTRRERRASDRHSSQCHVRPTVSDCCRALPTAPFPPRGLTSS